MRTLHELMDLTGRRALVTGGAGHIGLAVGEALVELGAVVAVADRDPDACEERAALLNRIGPGGAWPLAFDLSDEEMTRAAARRLVGAEGRLDIFVHCAAFTGVTEHPGWGVPFPEQSVGAWDAAMRVNLTSAFVIAQEAAEALAASRHGSVVLFSSIYGMVGPNPQLYEGTRMSNPAGYGASKAGILQLTRYLSAVLAPGVRVNAISPGGVFRRQPEVFVERYAERTMLGRMAAEEDLKGAVAYLCSDLSAYVTGHNLVVDGGWTVW